MYKWTTKDVYSGGIYTPRPTVWNIINSYGICVDENFIHPRRASYDFDSFYLVTELPIVKTANSTAKYTAKHVPLSQAVVSNIFGVTYPKVFANMGHP